MAELGKHTKLQWLRISGSKVSDEGLAHLTAFPQLESVILQSTAITDAGLNELAKAKQLKTLDLAFTRVTADGLKQLAGLRLSKLDIPADARNDAGLKHMLGAISRPKCQGLLVKGRKSGGIVRGSSHTTLQFRRHAGFGADFGLGCGRHGKELSYRPGASGTIHV